jgi:hypothetical protein
MLAPTGPHLCTQKPFIALYTLPHCTHYPRPIISSRRQYQPAIPKRNINSPCDARCHTKTPPLALFKPYAHICSSQHTTRSWAAGNRQCHCMCWLHTADVLYQCQDLLDLFCPANRFQGQEQPRTAPRARPRGQAVLVAQDQLTTEHMYILMAHPSDTGSYPTQKHSAIRSNKQQHSRHAFFNNKQQQATAGSSRQCECRTASH